MKYGCCLWSLIAVVVSVHNALAVLPGQIMVDPSSRIWMVYNRDADNDGRLDPAFICGPGDPEDFLYRGERNADGTRNGDQQAIIANMIAHGVNSIYFQVIRSHGGDGESSHNPYIDSNPDNPLDEDILSQWDDWFSALDAAGIVLYFFFYDDSARIWSGDTVNAAETNLITTLVNRYKHLKHLIWVVAEEYSERYSAARISNIARLIKSTDDNDHAVANHQLSGLVFDHADDPYLDQFAIQYNDTSVVGLHTGMITAWNNAAGRYGLTMSESADHGLGARDIVRQKNWACAMGGAYVMVIRMDGTVTYNEKMDDCATLKTFFEATDFNTMAPHDELGNDGTWVLADPGRSYIAYKMTPGSFILDRITAGTYVIKWLDTVTGKVLSQVKELHSGSNVFTPPYGINEEAAVWITRVAAENKRNPTISPLLLLLDDNP